MGSIVRADTSRFPVFTAELVMLERVVMATTWNAENLAWTVSTDLPRTDMSHRFAASPSPSRLLAALSRSSPRLSLSSVDRLVCTFCSNCRLSNRISTILSSIVLLMTESPPSRRILLSGQK